MTQLGHIVTGIISLIAVIYLMLRSSMSKDKDAGIEVVLLLPVLLFLANTL